MSKVSRDTENSLNSLDSLDSLEVRLQSVLKEYFVVIGSFFCKMTGFFCFRILRRVL